MSERKGVLLRLDPAVHDALARWAFEVTVTGKLSPF